VSRPRPARGCAAAALAVALLGAAAGCSRRSAGPHLEIAAATHEFGPLWIGEVVRHAFAVKNSGTQPLEFGEVRSTCGCLLHELSTRSLPPGASTQIVAELHADKGPGRLAKMLRIATNDPQRRWLELALAADLRVLYALEPPMVDAADLVLGEARDVVVKLSCLDGSALTFGTPQCPEKGFSASVRAVATDSAEIVVSFSGESWPGRRLFPVSVPTGHPRVPAATIPVQAVVLPRLKIEPTDRIDFGTVERARGARVELKVSHRGSRPLKTPPEAAVALARPSRFSEPAPAPDVAARIEPLVAGREWRLVVEVAAGSPGSSIVGRLTLRAAAPLEPPQVLTLTGRIVD
jgi:hypothetical protein